MSSVSINADLHSHSHVSDGLLAPAEVARRAHGNGVQLWALTDHDEVGGLEEAARAAAQLGMRFVPGVEVSVTWASETIHVVGLGFDVADDRLASGLARTRGGRQARAVEIGEQLAAVGLPGAYEGALRYVENPDLISRTHFARHLVDTGVCDSVSDVFDRYLSEGRPGYVEHRWARLVDAVRWIRDAGGRAVIAHPGRYKLGPTAMHALLTEFRQSGGEGLEVISGSHKPEHAAVFAAYAREFGFRGSRGSDYHGPGVSHAELGRVASIPGDIDPIWSDWV